VRKGGHRPSLALEPLAASPTAFVEDVTDSAVFRGIIPTTREVTSPALPGHALKDVTPRP